VKEVKSFKVGNVLLEYLIDKEKVYIFNPSNDRMVEGDQQTLTFLMNYHENGWKVPKVDDFLYGKKRKNWLHFKILQLELKGSWINKLLYWGHHIVFKSFFYLMIAFFFLTIPFVMKKAYLYYVSGSYQFEWYHIIYLITAQFIIILLHEFGHYYTYRKYVKIDVIRFGILIRYFFILLFFTNVNYMRTLTRKQRFYILISGILVQLFAGGILSLAYFISGHYHFLYLYMVNVIIVSINILPFLKLDGYWVINLLIRSDDYMRSFQNYLLKKERIRFIELLFAGFNLFIITSVIITGTLLVYSKMKELTLWLEKMY
jgi:putative peptide zinc metalloprotease protein